MKVDTGHHIIQARATIETEARAIHRLAEQIDDTFSAVCDAILASTGRVIVIGMGKSGHIGNKISATLSSTGTPSFFIHPAEAFHGDLGMITPQDIVIAISYSGETQELIALFPTLQHLNVTVVAITGNSYSTLAKLADSTLSVTIEKEACPLGLAPTTSTTATLVLGDALAIALLHARGFTKDHFARFHPGGSLGKKLLLKVSDIMHHGAALPLLTPETTLQQAIVEITHKRLGMAIIVDDMRVIGIFTDGDLRRALQQTAALGDNPIGTYMTTDPHTIPPHTLAQTALETMQQHKITSIVVTNQQHQPEGVIHLHDLLELGLT